MSKIRFIILVILVFVGIKTQAAKEVYLDFLQGNEIKTSVNDWLVGDIKYALYFQQGDPRNYSNLKVTNNLTFEIDHDAMKVSSIDYDEITISLRLYKYSALSNYVTEDVTMTIQKNAIGDFIDDKKVYVFSGYRRIVIDVLSITVSGSSGTSSLTVAPEDVKLTNEVIVDRCYTEFGNGVVQNIGHSTIQNGEAWVYWPYLPGAEEYELEWIHVSDVGEQLSTISPTDLFYSFKNNGTKVRIHDNFYRIPIIYERGYLIFRVRGVGRLCDHSDEEIYTEWTLDDNYPNIKHISDVPITSQIFIGSGVEHSASINWQYNATFAEDGLRKDVVTYYDGSLRNRQAVTKINSEKTTIVGETIYDFQGRPAVTILPTPAYSEEIKYFNEFNRNIGGEKFSREDFDLDQSTGSCNSSDAAAMSDLNEGAAFYYGTQKTDHEMLDAYQGNVPDSKGYPYTQVEYMPDNTGRIRRQGGVGLEFQLNSNRETKYLYGQPCQPELDRLFGSEVGYFSHYKKNVVTDPNGQSSVSYLDMHGRVVATALSGLKPATLDSVDGYLKYYNNNVTWNVLDGNNDTVGNSLIVNSYFTVTEDNGYSVYYLATGGKYEDECIPNICFDCVYDLKLRIYNECGDSVFFDDFRIGDMPNSEPESIECANPLDEDYYSKTLNLTVGYYHIEKTLSVNQEAVAKYADIYIEKNNCIKNINNFLTPELAVNNESDCEYTCEECMRDLDVNASDYNERYRECKEICSEYMSYCDMVRFQMLLDVSPNGQYAEYDLSTGTATNKPLSIFNSANELPNHPYWRNGTFKNDNGALTEIPYYDGVTEVYDASIDGSGANPLMVHPNANNQGYHFHPNNYLSIEDFCLNWENSWAEGLLNMHPEYLMLDWCDLIIQDTIKTGTVFCNSSMFDSLLIATDSYSEAVQLGLLASSPNSNYLSWPGANNDNETYYRILYKDPYFKNISSTYWNMMADMLKNPTNPEKTYYAMSAIAQRVPPQYTVSSISPNTLYDFASDPVFMNAEWELFKNLYLSQKQFIQTWHRTVWSFDNNASNYCIGTGNFFPDFVVEPSDLNTFLTTNEPCNISSFYLYGPKVKRFVDINDFFNGNHGQFNIQGNFYTDPASYVQQMEDQAGMENYSNLEICPLALELRFWLNDMIVANNLLVATDLNQTTSFGPSLYSAFASLAGTDATINSNAIWTPSYSGNMLSAEIRINNLQSCGTNAISLTKPTNVNWNNIHSIIALTDVAAYLSGYKFILKAIADDDDDINTPDVVINIEGYTCLPISGCDFSDVCGPTEELSDLTDLMNSFLVYNDYTSASINFINGDEAPLVTNRLRNIVGNNLTTWELASTGTNTHTIHIHSSGTSYYQVVFNCSVFNATNVLYRFDDVSSDPNSGNNCFVLKVRMFDAMTNAFIGVETVTGCVTIEPGPSAPLFDAGLCDTELQCQGFEMKTRLQLELFMNKIVEENEFLPSVQVNLTTNSFVGDNLLSNLGVLSGNSLYWYGNDVSPHKYVGGFTVQQGNTNLNEAMCNLELEFHDATPAFDIEDIVEFSNLLVDETNAQFGKYYHFTVMAANSNNEYELMDGVSCFPLMNCSSCPPLNEPVFTENFDGGVMLGNSQVPVAGSTCYTYNEYRVIQDANAFCSSRNYNLLDTHLPGSGYYMIVTKPNENEFDPPVFIWYKDNIPVENNKEYTISFEAGYPVDTSDYARSITAWANGSKEVSHSSDIGNGWFKNTFTWFSGPSDNLDLAFTTFNCTNRPVALDDILIYLSECPPANFAPQETPIIGLENPCDSALLPTAQNNAQLAFDWYNDSVRTSIMQVLNSKCLRNAVETFNISYKDHEHHYTLYYYDQAGNLVRTVPPKGVERVSETSFATVDTDRKQHKVAPSKQFFTNHSYASTYKYNSLNQVVSQETPDAGISNFWYDMLGRIVLSQNAEQNTHNNYSYTIYDEQGRISEVGEIESSSAPTAGNGGFIADADLQAWWSLLINTVRKQVTKTFYDEAVLANMLPSGATQECLRGRVASIAYYDELSSSINDYDVATHYSYDVHGNVKTIYQEIDAMENYQSRFKKIEYEYDLISGKVLLVKYQVGAPDQFFHKYIYDADNRITNVFTSRDSLIWDQDAKYFYYLHGPLARTEIGEQKVQGVDYVYTLQGWIKGINSTNLDGHNDVGKDGVYDDATGQGTYLKDFINIHKGIPEDAASYSLNYYKDVHNLSDVYDYEAIKSSSNNFLATDAYNVSNNLYNGNISSMVTTIYPTSGSENADPLLYKYKYDQLNRIKEMQAYRSEAVLSLNTWATPSQVYASLYGYDPNGNIDTLMRECTGTNVFDELKYKYIAQSNRLDYVTDKSNSVSIPGEITSQSSGNYRYDEIGNLIADVGGNLGSNIVDGISWTVYGKIKHITFASGSIVSIDYLYDPMGNRIEKKVTYDDQVLETWYIRDAQGNIMSTYTVDNNSELMLGEIEMYGSSRLGSIIINTPIADLHSDSIKIRTLGHKLYELSNHLGNVITTVSDVKPIDVVNGSTVDQYIADLQSSVDYFPFGAQLPGRGFSTSSYRFGFNGQEKDNEVYGEGNAYTAMFWEYDPRIGRRWNRDPFDKPWMSPYHAFSNKPIFNIDPNGAVDGGYEKDWNEETQQYDAPKKVNDKGGEDFDYTLFNGGPLDAQMQTLNRKSGECSWGDYSTSEINPLTGGQFIRGSMEYDLWIDPIDVVAGILGGIAVSAGKTTAKVASDAAIKSGDEIANAGANLIDDATNAVKPKLNPVNTGTRVGSAAYKSLNSIDAQHFYSNIIDNYASDAAKFTVKGADDVVRDLYQVSGSLNGKSGVFEWMVEGIKIVHRRFIEGKVVNGIPN